MENDAPRTTKPRVLQALSAVRTDDGSNLLVSGHVQDVLIEWHGEDGHVVVLLDPVWTGPPPAPGSLEHVRERPPSEGELARIRQAVAALPGIVGVKTVLRPQPGSGGGAGAENTGGESADGSAGAPNAATSGAAKADSAHAGAIEARRRAAAMRPGLPPPKVPEGARLIAVASGKGGVGKSTVSVNLAVALARRGLRVAVVDCDVYGFSVPMLIGLREGPHIEDKKIVPPLAHGVQVVSMDFLVKGNAAVVYRGPMLGKTLRQFMQDVRWDAPQIMVLDLPPGTGDVALDVQNFFPKADQIVVTTPDPFAARVAERAGRMAVDAGHRLLGVVENMAYTVCEDCGREMRPFGRGGGDAAANALGVEVMGRLPFEEPRPGRRDGLFAADSLTGRAYEQLAERVLAADAGTPVAAAQPASPLGRDGG